MSKKTYSPGQKAPASGQYGIVGTKAERTVVKGEPLPPPKRAGQRYELRDKTRTK